MATAQPQIIPSRRDDEELPQYTWMEAILIPYCAITYIAGLCITIAAIAEKFRQDEPPDQVFLYLLFFLLGHLLAGFKNLQYHWMESQSNEEEPNWPLHILMLPVSPLIRYSRAWSFGRAEVDDPENGLRFIDESVNVGVLRLFIALLCDAPILVLLLRDDVWGNSDAWQQLIMGSGPKINCEPVCPVDPPPDANLAWVTARLMFLGSQVAQTLTFYNLMVKRYQHLETPEYFENIHGEVNRQGRVNIFGCFTLFASHLLFTGSRVMGYSLLVSGVGSFVYLVVGIRWFFNTSWHMIMAARRRFNTASRSLSSFVMGGVWIFALTNEDGGRQLGRYFVYYGMALVETVFCGYFFYWAGRGSGDFFLARGPFSALITFLGAVVIMVIYYTLFHPSSPKFSRRGFLCCSGDRRDPISEEDYGYYPQNPYAHVPIAPQEKMYQASFQQPPTKSVQEVPSSNSSWSSSEERPVTHSRFTSDI